MPDSYINFSSEILAVSGVRNSAPQTVWLANGNFVVTWTDGGTYVGQAYDPAGAAVGSTFTISSASPRSGPTIALDDGGFLATWDTGTGPILSHAQRYDAAGATVGSAFDIVNGAAVTSAIQLAGGGFVLTWTGGSRSGGDASGNAVDARVARNRERE